MSSPYPDYPDDAPLLAQLRRDRRPRLRVSRPGGLAVVLGRGSRPELELELQAVDTDRVPVWRRAGGGCAVVLDPGQLVVAVALPAAGIGGSLGHFSVISGWLAAGLARLGIPGVRREGSSDLVLGDRKVGGACIYRAKDELLYSTTLLVDPQVQHFSRYLRHPPREPDYRRGRAHDQFVGSLAPVGADVARFAVELERTLELEQLQLHA